MTGPPEALLEESTGCLYCGEKAEPEQDGDVVFFACTGCGGTFGHRKVTSGAFCAAGLPVAEPEPAFIATTIKRRPE